MQSLRSERKKERVAACKSYNDCSAGAWEMPLRMRYKRELGKKVYILGVTAERHCIQRHWLFPNGYMLEPNAPG
jgi:hypothetical protein